MQKKQRAAKPRIDRPEKLQGPPRGQTAGSRKAQAGRPTMADHDRARYPQGNKPNAGAGGPERGSQSLSGTGRLPKRERPKPRASKNQR